MALGGADYWGGVDFMREPFVPPLAGLVGSVCAVSHPDRVGVGYGMPSLRDFRHQEVSLLRERANEHHANAEAEVTP